MPSRHLIARAIRVQMTRQDMSQTALALKMGKGQQWISRRIGKHADVALDFDDLDAFAAALDAPLSVLLESANIRCNMHGREVDLVA